MFVMILLMSLQQSASRHGLGLPLKWIFEDFSTKCKSCNKNYYKGLAALFGVL
jgi:hypothetical protein